MSSTPAWASKLHLTAHNLDKASNTPEVKSIKKFCAEEQIELMMWNDDQLRSVVHLLWGDEAVNCFDDMSGIMKADMGRYAVLYVFGGFYMDTDVLVTENISKLLANNLKCNLWFAQSPPIWPWSSPKITNYVLASSPSNEFWTHVAHEIVKRQQVFGWRHYAPFATGAWMLTDVAERRGQDWEHQVFNVELLGNKLCFNNNKNGKVATHDGGTSRNSGADSWISSWGVQLLRTECRLRQDLNLSVDTVQAPVIILCSIFGIVLGIALFQR